ncbi:glycosyltransferase family 4 protein [Acidaminobacter sp. JC074]|uniref:glycosyltransferase family 4 protein n=1 Tax=Acidaminobacter sp. JC074 TaxID=2530199 RepID=UPI001F0EA567|nr:glycosyltransferase family 4 protein [Acidaminobacter sp. JC074]MCH4887189.1 glycosyltransferase family 4 protein [Acidaminobacter sp. JC074]
MRILILNHFPLEGSGSGIYTKNLARELSEMGHTVKVVFPEIEEVSFDEFETRVILFKGPQTENPEFDFNFPCFTSHPRSVNTYYELDDNQLKAYVQKFVDVTKEEVENFKPDLIHAQHLWVTPYAAAQTGVPYIVTAHGTDLKGFVKDDRYHKYALEGAKKAAKVITISEQVDEEVTTLYGVPEDKKELVLNGYDENLFKVKDLNCFDVLNDFNLSLEPDYVVSFAGKLTHFKGVDVLLKAARIYNEAIDGEVVTLIAGNGELYEELNKLKMTLKLDHVQFLGHVNQHQLVDLYNIADVSTVPSRTEPFGLVAIEALACGTPVVGTNQGGLPDFLIEDVGTLVPVDDDIALADAIVAEIKHKEKEKRAKAAADYALKNFSWKRSIGVVASIYESII